MNKMESLPNIITKTLDDIAPKKPKKFLISEMFASFPILGSFGLWVKILIARKEERPIKASPKITFDKNSLKLP